MYSIIRAAIPAAALMFAAAFPAAAEPAATDLLFKLRQLDLVTKGSQITYKFERKTTHAQILGKDFSDELRLQFTKIGERGQRDVEMYVFSGNAARDVQNWPDLSTNPLFLWYLDRAVVQLATMSGLEKMYLKGRIRSTFDDKGKVEAIKYPFNGGEVDAFRITLLPLKNDPVANKMEGYDHSHLTFVVSDAVPGYFLEMTSTVESPMRGRPVIEERLHLVKAEEAE